MSRACMVELATRHSLNPERLVEDWVERAAIREYLGGFSRQGSELWAIGDVERQYQIGLHCPASLKRWIAGGVRKGPGKAAVR